MGQNFFYSQAINTTRIETLRLFSQQHLSVLVMLELLVSVIIHAHVTKQPNNSFVIFICILETHHPSLSLAFTLRDLWTMTVTSTKTGSHGMKLDMVSKEQMVHV